MVSHRHVRVDTEVDAGVARPLDALPAHTVGAGDGTFGQVRRIALCLVAAVVAASCATTPGVVSVRTDLTARGDDQGEEQADDPADDPAVGTDTLAWGPCAESSSAFGPPIRCATLAVPLDHDDPDGESIDIELAQVATADADRRIGSLVLNPGGPGGSGIEFLQSAAIVMPPEIAERFDLVSFDPRGVGESTAVECDVDFDDEIALLPPGDDAAWQELVAEAEAFPSTCTSETARIAPWLGTNNAARDLDLIRAAVGDDALTYVGFSYGTRLGATYAELFPDTVRALVLDGAVKPTPDFAELDAEQAASLDRAFERFAAECDGDPDCPLSAIGPTLEVYEELIATVDGAGSLATDDPDRVVTAGELHIAAIAALYSTQLWPVLARGLADAATGGDATVLQALTDSYLGRQPDGSYDDSQSAGFAINCADDAERPPVEVVRTESERIAERTQWFDDLLRASTGCIGAAPPVDPLIVGPAEGAAPILVIGTTGDPATPYEWAVEMADSLVSAELYTVESDGHTAFLSVPCVEPIVVDYLVDLVVPASGGSCSNDAVLDAFPPAGEDEFGALIAFFDCLRENGADIPEISIVDLLADPSGESLLEGIDPSDPSFGLAVLACEDLIPD
jgi:pimeloyl-ACP methyl ester carboxylesterase